MSPRICICCGEPMVKNGKALSRNPNMCASCSSMTDGMDGSNVPEQEEAGQRQRLFIQETEEVSSKGDEGCFKSAAGYAFNDLEVAQICNLSGTQRRRPNAIRRYRRIENLCYAGSLSYFFSNSSSPLWARTLIRSPGLNSPRSSLFAKGSRSRSWMVRFRGRAPNCGS